MNTMYKYVYIRHGETEFNEHTQLYDYNSIKCNYKYLNCKLSPKGETQAYEVGKVIKDMNVKKVFVSPFKRSLQTATLMLKEYNKDNICVYVHPLLSEVVDSVQSLCCNVQEMKDEYNMNSNVKVNWSEYFDKEFISVKEQDLFCIGKYYIDTLSQKQRDKVVNPVYKAYDKDGNTNIPQLLGNVVTYAKKSGIKRLETVKHGYERAIKFKEFLKETFHNDDNTDNNVNDSDTVLIVTHKSFIKLSTTSSSLINISNNKYPNDCYTCNNCEMFYINI